MATNFPEEILSSNLLETVRISIHKQKGAQRQVHVQMTIPHTVEQVWQLITDYDRLTELIPNLVHCRQIGHTEASKHLELVGSCRILNFWFSIRLVLEAIEFPPYQIDTQLIEGDLRSYSGRWHLAPDQDGSTVLSYTAEMVPKPGIPVALLERQIQHLLPINFLAIRHHLDRVNQTMESRFQGH
jgi:ribosome-associated toxin RatA of RatAB toxin-antitoxin module